MAFLNAFVRASFSSSVREFWALLIARPNMNFRIKDTILLFNNADTNSRDHIPRNKDIKAQPLICILSDKISPRAAITDAHGTSYRRIVLKSIFDLFLDAYIASRITEPRKQHTNMQVNTII